MYGPLFEHLLGLKPWDLDRMTRDQVAYRLAWLKKQQKTLERTGGPDG